MTFNKADVLGEVTPKKTDGAFGVNAEMILARNFEFSDTVVYAHCLGCGLTFEVNEPFKQMFENELGAPIENDRQYFQMEKCHSCLGVKRVENISIQEVSIN